MGLLFHSRRSNDLAHVFLVISQLNAFHVFFMLANQACPLFYQELYTSAISLARGPYLLSRSSLRFLSRLSFRTRHYISFRILRCRTRHYISFRILRCRMRHSISFRILSFRTRLRHIFPYASFLRTFEFPFLPYPFFVYSNSLFPPVFDALLAPYLYDLLLSASKRFAIQ
jgi:hypothetical protein